MRDYIRNGVKVLVGYLVTLLIFAVFIYVFMSITREAFNQWLPLYSFLLFLLGAAIIYSDMNKLAVKEKKPQYQLNPYPLKGLIYGLLGFLPIALVEIISVFITFGNQFADRIEHLTVNTLMGPLYFIIRFFGESPVGYMLASLAVPVMAMLGYMAGYHGIRITGYLKKDYKPAEKGFKKSPWNPTYKAQPTVKKKKKRGV